jgi:hypothetical protein
MNLRDQSKIIHNGILLKVILRGMQSVQPTRWLEVLEEMRHSRRLRRYILRAARNDSTFRLYCACRGIKI